MWLASANTDVLIWVAVLLGAVLSGSLLILSLRKRVFASPKAPSDPGTLMEQLRDMERRGEITREEFDRVRRRLIEQASAPKHDANDR
ncbi:MAG: SHOCT domain-containing protein [Phycisphaerales bacterium]